MIADPQPTRVPYYQVQGLADASFRLLEIRGAQSGCSWHFHPEHQLGYVIQGDGKRVVGDSICPINCGEVVLLGANLPHVWRYNEQPEPGDEAYAIVIHFGDAFLGSEFFHKPEMRDIRLLLSRASLGLQAKGETREQAAKIFHSMLQREGFGRVLDLLSLLHLLAVSSELETISSAGFQCRSAEVEIERLRRVYDYVQSNYSDSIDRDSVAAIAHLSPSAFSRFFKKHTGKTFLDFLNEVRVGQACRLLMEPEFNITEVARLCGFADISTFDRSFRRIKEMNPSEYRQRICAITGLQSQLEPK